MLIRKILHQFLNDWNRGVGSIRCAEQQFIFGIVLPAKTGKIFVGAGIETFDRLQIADGRGERLVIEFLAAGARKELERADDGQGVIHKRDGGDTKTKILEQYQVGSPSFGLSVVPPPFRDQLWPLKPCFFRLTQAQ